MHALFAAINSRSDVQPLVEIVSNYFENTEVSR